MIKDRASHTEKVLREEIIFSAKRLHKRNMLAAADGNISYRLTNDRILITPAGVAKSLIHPEDIAVITIDNQIISGHPSSERLMHLAVYQHCPQAQCVVHAHPPTAIAWSIARPHLTELPSRSLSELIISVGRIPIVPYARPGTQSMGDVLLPYLPVNRLMILARHGGLAWGESLGEAVNGLERLEHTAEILFRAEQLGGISDLPNDEIHYLQQLRKKLGDRIL